MEHASGVRAGIQQPAAIRPAATFLAMGLLLATVVGHGFLCRAFIEAQSPTHHTKHLGGLGR